MHVSICVVYVHTYTKWMFCPCVKCMGLVTGGAGCGTGSGYGGIVPGPAPDPDSSKSD